MACLVTGFAWPRMIQARVLFVFSGMRGCVLPNVNIIND